MRVFGTDFSAQRLDLLYAVIIFPGDCFDLPPAIVGRGGSIRDIFYLERTARGRTFPRPLKQPAVFVRACAPHSEPFLVVRIRRDTHESRRRTHSRYDYIDGRLL